MWRNDCKQVERPCNRTCTILTAAPLLAGVTQPLMPWVNDVMAQHGLIKYPPWGSHQFSPPPRGKHPHTHSDLLVMVSTRTCT